MNKVARISSRDEELKNASKEALSNITPEKTEDARKSRESLVGWLVKMHDDIGSLRGIVNDEVTNVAIASLHSVLKRCMKQQKKEAVAEKVKDVIDALNALPDAEILDCFAFMLKSVLTKIGAESRLFSQNLMTERWEETGFFIDDDVGIAGVSIASTLVHRDGQAEKSESMPYQPIGFINGDHYLATESSKLLWARKFAIGAMVPYPPAFHVELREVMAKYDANAPLTEAQSKRAEELIALLENDLLQYDKSEDPKERAHISDAMMTGIELAAVGLRPLAKLIETIQNDHPEVGARFENANMRDLALAVNQFLRERIAADAHARIQDSTELVVTAADPKQTAVSLLATVEGVLAEGDAVDHPRAWTLIAQYKTVYSEDRAALVSAQEEGKDTRAILEMLVPLLKARA